MTETLETYLEQFRGDDVRLLRDLPHGAYEGMVPQFPSKRVVVLVDEDRPGESPIRLLALRRWLFHPDDVRLFVMVEPSPNWTIWGAERTYVKSEMRFPGMDSLVKAASTPAQYTLTVGNRVYGWDSITGDYETVLCDERTQ